MREFRPFDAETIRKELLRLPAKDHKALTVAMLAYQEELESGYRLRDYGDGLKMITDSGIGGLAACLQKRKPKGSESGFGHCNCAEKEV